MVSGTGGLGEEISARKKVLVSRSHDCLLVFDGEWLREFLDAYRDANLSFLLIPCIVPGVPVQSA